jgi:glycosyltransferase involved in cell wall biosynthesis
MGGRHQIQIMNHCTIISPSGNFYGSEQVLFDFLTNTDQVFTIFVPTGSLFQRQLEQAGLPHRIETFDPRRLPQFYGRIFLRLARGKIGTLYVNEAGHSKYVILLARWYRKKKFVIHVRISEDTDPSRWPAAALPNLQLIVISRFIENKLLLPAVCITDPYLFTDRPLRQQKIDPAKLTIGIVGRITLTKGLDKLVELTERAKEKGLAGQLVFHLFGDISGSVEDEALVSRLRAMFNIAFEGFVADKSRIYEQVDCVLHLSVVEPLGRIFFEALDYGKPFIGFDAAGIGEIGRLTGMDQALILPDGDWAEKMLQRLVELDAGYFAEAAAVQRKKEACKELLFLERYVAQLNELITT